MIQPWKCLVLAVGAVAFFTGCLPQDGTGTSSGSTASSSGSSSGDAGATTTAGKACLDTADAYATAAQRCGSDYAAEHASFIKNLANGDCNSVAVRDESQLRSQCIPSLAVIACDALQNGRLDPSCAEQFTAK
jgi:hypothetical protein